ncbi:unnamed protein product, partial [Arabidopsis halleri]
VIGGFGEKIRGLTSVVKSNQIRIIKYLLFYQIVFLGFSKFIMAVCGTNNG